MAFPQVLWLFHDAFKRVSSFRGGSRAFDSPQYTTDNWISVLRHCMSIGAVYDFSTPKSFSPQMSLLGLTVPKCYGNL